MKYSYHVIPHPKGWAIKKSNAKRYSRIYSSKEKAFNKARELAIINKTRLFMHRKDGKIQTQRNYDPYFKKNIKFRKKVGSLKVEKIVKN